MCRGEEHFIVPDPARSGGQHSRLREEVSPLGLLSAFGCGLCLCQALSLFQLFLPELDAVCLVCSRVKLQWGLAGERLGGEEEANLLLTVDI